MRAVIELEGGLISRIFSDEPLEVMVIDQDSNDIEDDDHKLINLHGNQVFVTFYDADEDETIVEDVFSQGLIDVGEESEEES